MPRSKFGIGATELEVGGQTHILIREDDLIGIMPSSNATADGARSIRALSAHMCRNAAAVEGPVPLASASPLASPVHALVFF